MNKKKITRGVIVNIVDFQGTHREYFLGEGDGVNVEFPLEFSFNDTDKISKKATVKIRWDIHE